MSDLKKMYSTMSSDPFPEKMEIAFYTKEERQALFYEKVQWEIDGEMKGLRYGENPDQPAAFYKLVNGNLILAEVQTLESGQYLLSDAQLLQSGKHPGKINITDIDAALNILRYFTDQAAAVIIKHNNPCGVALGSSLEEAYQKAFLADRLAAFGGAVALNRTVDKATAEAISASYVEVVAAPGYEAGALELLKSRKNLRIMQINSIERLQDFVGQKVLDFKSLIDGGIIVQYQFEPLIKRGFDFLPAKTVYKGEEYQIAKQPNETMLQDMLFGWLVEAGVTSNSVIYVKDGATVGIGTGEQDRVGVAQIARDKAYRKYADRLSWETYDMPYNQAPVDAQKDVWAKTETANGGLLDSVMISDAFFPFRDGVDVGIAEGISGVVQPGGSLRDYEVINACNEAGICMVFTGQRSFKH